MGRVAGCIITVAIFQVLLLSDTLFKCPQRMKNERQAERNGKLYNPLGLKTPSLQCSPDVFQYQLSS